MGDASPARRVAVRVVFRVIDDGAWTAPALDAEIARNKLDPRDAGLATEICYGALRVLPALNAMLDAHLAKPKKLDAYVRAVLIVGAYQIVHLSRVPPHAAVSDAVAIAKSERGVQLGGLVNAVLRKIERPAEPEQPRAIVLPAWLDGMVRASLGEQAEAFLSARALPPPIGLRAKDPEALAASIRNERPGAEVGIVPPRGVWVRGAGDPRTLPGYAEGAFAVQELGSQRIVELAQIEPGMRVADLCAGHGTKTLAIAERADVVAVDLYEEKLERLERERARLRPSGRVETMACDLTVGTGGLGREFDRVLVDAPCTGVGTVHRRPELTLRLQPNDPQRMADLQVAIATRGASLVKDGGLLIYAVCSPTKAEGPRAVERIEAACPQLEREETVRIGPWMDGAPDAYHVARWRVRAQP